MRLLELFAGSATMTKVAREYGLEAVATDITQYGDIDVVCDIFQLPDSLIDSGWDVVWASPPCTAFSVASIGHHWNPDGTPKTEGAVIGQRLVERTVELIDRIQPKKWYIENPRGMMRRLPILQDLVRSGRAVRHTITYCQYGERRQKPTDIWTNDLSWQPRPACKPKSSCHDSAPRGARTGTQGLKGAFDRSKLPVELCREIVSNV